MNYRVAVGLMACVVSLGVSTHPSAWAWGDKGHKIVATIAYARLTPAAKTQVDAMLADDSDPLTAPDFARRATWADKWRDFEREPKRVNFNATREWHFVNVDNDGGSVDTACGHHPPLPAGTPASQGPPMACVVDKINQFQAELRNPATPAPERLLALKYLLHLVGDLHQPLHASNHRGDNGGNGQKVLYSQISKPDNLHTYWDRHLVQALGRNANTANSVGLALNDAITPTQANQWAGGDTRAWAQQSAAMAKAVAYNFNGLKWVDDLQGGKAPYLDHVYDKRALPVVTEQLSKAGLRLSTLLNTALR